jgi:hypothetical protein
MILIPLLFSIIITTTILKAKCDLSNKGIEEFLKKPEEVCILNDVLKDIKSLYAWSEVVAEKLKYLLDNTEELKMNQDKIFKWGKEYTEYRKSRYEVRPLTNAVRNSMYV